ncbi:ABC transporter substrate-binding protein [Salarchaeum sp. JOR-1]|nr:ABC transporter substrate-binding protein [Salarchaeum sp. JOR-1]
MPRDTMTDVDRRTMIKLTGGAGVAGLTGLAGCSTTGSTDTTTEGGTGTDTTTADSGSGPYNIGMVDALTGSLSAFGQRNQRGKDIALADVNAVGVNGRDLSISVEDSGSQSSGGVSAAQKLVNQDGVPFVIGAVGSGVSLAIYESVIQGTDVVQVSQNSTGLGLTEFPGLLRVSPTGRTQSRALANIIAEDGYDTVAMTYVNNNYGSSLADAFANAWDGTMAYNNPHDQDQQSYSGVISEMNSSGADAWLFITYQAEFATMVNEMYSSGYDPQLYGADSVSGDNVLENTPEGSIDGMKVVVPSAPVEQQNYKEFVSTFESEYGESPTVWSAYAYDAVAIAALSIQAADEFTGAALSDVVRDVTRPEGQKATSYKAAHDILADGGSPSDVDYQGVSGPIDFDENGDPVGFLQIQEVRNHSYERIGFIES